MASVLDDPGVSRHTWLQETRRRCEERMDTMFAPIYDDQWGSYINVTHGETLARVLALCPPGGIILDAACGTGRYWTVIRESGRTVAGIDQSGAMLARARAKFPDVLTAKLGLQELPYRDAFRGIVCIDAMENICREDWPLVLTNFHQALQHGGYLYFTVEIAPDEEIRAAYEAGLEQGLPLVEGEWAHQGGYHYYPRIPQVREWIRTTGFAIVEEIEGDGYRHFLAQRNPSRISYLIEGEGHDNSTTHPGKPGAPRLRPRPRRHGDVRVLRRDQR